MGINYGHRPGWTEWMRYHRMNLVVVYYTQSFKFMCQVVLMGIPVMHITGV